MMSKVFSIFQFANYTSWCTDRHNARQNIFRHHRTSADHRPIAHRTLRNDRSTDTDQCPYTNPHITTQMDTGGNMGVIADVIVVVDGTPRV